MSKILLIHNSDDLRLTFKPWDDSRPIFYWYTDRFASHIGTMNYLYFFLVNPESDGIELRCRTDTQDFDALHKGFLRYRDFCEGKSPELKYEEPGIAMSFSTLKPDLILVADQNAAREGRQFNTYLILHPNAGKAKSVDLFREPFPRKELIGQPLKFTDIPGLVEALPDINDALPFKDITPDSSGIYRWLPMLTRKNGTGL